MQRMIIVSPLKGYMEDVGFDGYSSAEFEIEKSDENVSNCSKHESDVYV